ncbi:hypothetical protein KJ365_11775 [Glaciecola sp. XM2]|jgi:hypothetical protein|uniref:hypothetical protein n=1 Tax=Glaciecola sp. XM2 TaxID=1914931 RepID=UPI001BDE1D3C|nr:hypothetical protein [Glaciecola sp. XM2]MBT1451560.1 hypothetical protein [Glaciecola sp. XM2]
MNLADANLYLVVAVTMLGAVGITLFFVGSLITVAAAFANNQKVFAIACILFLPLTTVYCLMHRDHASYPAKYVFSGIALVALTLSLTMWIL